MIYIIILALVAAVDLLIKNHIEFYYFKGKEKKIFHNLITITRYHNDGGFLNFMQNRKLFLKVASAILYVICFISFIILIVKKQDALKKLALALILGGGLSNEIDRIKKGCVTDYFSINLPIIRNIVFNLGDFAIFAGIIILLYEM